MTSTEIGRKAETAAKVYLEMRGFKIIEQNYRRPNCEIDIVAKKNGMIYFVEVKYRKDDDQGGGLEAITASKLKRMRNAVYTWVDEYKWHGEYAMSAIEIMGPNFSVMAFIEDIF